MARRSTKENKTIYQRTREDLDLTREEASELLITMSAERIEKIESERSMPHPDEVLLMSPAVIEPIQNLKVEHLGNINPRIHTDETLIALSICAATSPVAQGPPPESLTPSAFSFVSSLG